MKETKLMFEAQDLYNRLKELLGSSVNHKNKRLDVFLVLMARNRYHRRMKAFIRKINEKRVAAEENEN